MGEAKRRQAEIETIKRGNEQSDRNAGVVTQWPVIPEAEYMAGMASGAFRGRVVHTVMRHDDWCCTRNGGSGFDCNCEPIVSHHLQPLE